MDVLSELDTRLAIWQIIYLPVATQGPAADKSPLVLKSIFPPLGCKSKMKASKAPDRTTF